MGSKEQKAPQISDAEWRVMKIVWEKHPITSKAIVEALEDSSSWKPKTIHTLIGRLVQKGAVIAGKEGREYQFSPAIKEEACQREEAASFLERVFGGEVAPFLACFVKTNKLTRAEVEELKRILDGKV